MTMVLKRDILRKFTFSKIGARISKRLKNEESIGLNLPNENQATPL
jgi:hypothetical protein